MSVSKKGSCCYCQQAFELSALRPFGIDGALTCFPCMKADAEREKLAGQTFLREISKPGLHVLTAEGIDTIPLSNTQVLSVVIDMPIRNAAKVVSALLDIMDEISTSERP